MVEQCLKNIQGVNPAKVPFYMWIRRLLDTVDLHIREDSIHIRKQADIVKNYEQVMPLIYTIFERLLGENTVNVPEALDGVAPARAVAMSREYDLSTIDGVIDSIGFMLQLLGLYIQCKKDGEHHFIDLFYLVMYQLLYNIHVIIKHPNPLKFYDVRRSLYVQGVRT